MTRCSLFRRWPWSGLCGFAGPRAGTNPDSCNCRADRPSL